MKEFSKSESYCISDDGVKFADILFPTFHVKSKRSVPSPSFHPSFKIPLD